MLAVLGAFAILAAVLVILGLMVYGIFKVLYIAFKKSK